VQQPLQGHASLRLIHEFLHEREGHRRCIFLFIIKLYGQVTSAPYMFYWILLYIFCGAHTTARPPATAACDTIPYFTCDSCHSAYHAAAGWVAQHPDECRSSAGARRCLVLRPSLICCRSCRGVTSAAHVGCLAVLKACSCWGRVGEAMSKLSHRLYVLQFLDSSTLGTHTRAVPPRAV